MAKGLLFLILIIKPWTVSPLCNRCPCTFLDLPKLSITTLINAMYFHLIIFYFVLIILKDRLRWIFKWIITSKFYLCKKITMLLKAFRVIAILEGISFILLFICTVVCSHCQKENITYKSYSWNVSCIESVTYVCLSPCFCPVDFSCFVCIWQGILIYVVEHMAEGSKA